MATINLGQAAIVSKGAYSAAASYAPLNLVTHNGGSYLCKRGCSNIEPGVSPTWQTYWVAATVGIRSFAKTGETADGMEYTATLSDNSTYVFVVKTAVDYPISVANGGTGATTAEAARENLGALSNANGAVQTANIGDGVVTRAKMAQDAVALPFIPWYPADNPADPFIASNHGKVIYVQNSTAVSHELTAEKLASLPTGFTLTIWKAVRGDFTIAWTGIACDDFVQRRYNNTSAGGSITLRDWGDCVTVYKESNSTIALFGQQNVRSTYDGTTEPSADIGVDGDVYLRYAN